MEYAAEFITIGILVLLSAFFSAAEIALVSLSRFRLRHLIEKKVAGAAFIKRLKDDPRRMLTTILVGNNLVNTAAAAIATGVSLDAFQNNALAIATGIMTFLLLFFGEVIPKSLAIRYTTAMSLFFAPIIWGMSIVFAPIIKVFQLLLKGVDALFGVKKSTPTITEEELKSIVQMGEEEGAINEVERSMIHRIFDFDDIPVSEIMTPKADMVMVSAKSPLKDALALNTKKQFTRLPVYEKSKENIVGMFHVKDAMRHVALGKGNMAVEKVMRKPLFVPEAKKLDSVLRLFQKSKEHLAVVVNEHGSISGLITIEDVLEEIVGEIMDETDRIEHNIRKVSKKAWLVSGKTPVEELKEKLGMNGEDRKADTLNGALQEITGRIPKEGEEITYGKFTITIVEMEGHRVKLAKISK